MRDHQDVSDLTIIGGGPTGLFAAFYAGMRQMSAKIVDALPQLGGQLTALYAEKPIYDMPGFKQVIARDLVTGFERQALQFGAAVCLNEKALTLKRLDNDTIELTTDRTIHYSKTLLIAAGIGAFTPRKLNLTGTSKFEGRSIVYAVPDIEFLRNKRVLIVGGGDSAADWALMLESVAASVDLVHRRDRFRAHEGSADKLMNSSVNVHLFHEVAEVIGNNHVESAVIYHNKTNERRVVELDVIIMALGFTTDLGPIKNWNLELDGADIVVNRRMETNISGVFAAGDVTTYEGKIKLIATGVAEATMAVNYAKTIVDPAARAQPAYSTITGVPSIG